MSTGQSLWISPTRSSPGTSAAVKTATTPGAEVAGHVRPGEVGALLVDLRLGPHNDAGDAEPALQAAARGEGIGVTLALDGREAFERGDRLAGDLRQWLL